MTKTKETKLQDELTKTGVLLRGDDERLIPTRLPTGLTPIDDIIGGGIPYGACTLLVGPESTGKTILCQYAIAAQQRSETKPHVLFLDAERTYDPDWWKQSGVDLALLTVARPTTGEQLIDLTMEMLATQDDIGMIVLDSIAALPPSKIVQESAERHDIGSLARLATLFFVKLMSELGPSRIFIATNQLRENIGGYGDTFPGGRSQKFFAHLIMRTRREGWIEEGKTKIGFNLEVATVKNKTAAPQQVATLPFLFRSQVDMLSVLIEDAVERGLIRKAGPYYYVGEEKMLGKAALRAYLAEHPDVQERIR